MPAFTPQSKKTPTKMNNAPNTISIRTFSSSRSEKAPRRDASKRQARTVICSALGQERSSYEYTTTLTRDSLRINEVECTLDNQSRLLVKPLSRSKVASRAKEYHRWSSSMSRNFMLQLTRTQDTGRQTTLLRSND
ncbi:hypothetical protein PIIN_08362 [Serendipita indica DSM 11827]|uniref:Uncharacterized protein n=1 Tax=Serendipita indica (strain DSM 11827) TaxID=1109443 RepID=G4TSW7_SERID|nr:hypothetical protein PIIN_08362 [Serendipita indica DSM 11827]